MATETFESLFSDKTGNELLKTILKVLGDESDRGCALVGASMLDQGLESLLSQRFPKMVELKVFEDRDLMRGMYAKITMAAALDLITEGERQFLNSLRGIRNEFAHPEALGMTFDSPSPKAESHLKNIVVPKETFDKAVEFGIWMDNRNLTAHPRKIQFMVATATMAIVLHGNVSLS